MLITFFSKSARILTSLSKFRFLGCEQGSLSKRTRIRCKVKSTFSETRLVPALNDLLIANPSPGSVSRFRLGWLSKLDGESPLLPKDAKTRFAGISYDVKHSLNVWSSGMWVSTR